MLRYLLLAATLVGSALGDATYADDFARDKMWPAAASAYSSKPEKCFENKFHNATVRNSISSKKKSASRFFSG